MITINPNQLADALIAQLKSLGIAVETSPTQANAVPGPRKSYPGQPAISTSAFENAAEKLADAKAALADAQDLVDSELEILVGQLNARGIAPTGTTVLVIDGTGVLATKEV